MSASDHNEEQGPSRITQDRSVVDEGTLPHAIPVEPPHRCRTCRYWDMLSLDMTAGDCRAPDSALGPHRYGRTLMPDGTYALWDSFGREETKPDYVCGAWDDGWQSARIAAALAAGTGGDPSPPLNAPTGPGTPPNPDRTSQ